MKKRSIGAVVVALFLLVGLGSILTKREDVPHNNTVKDDNSGKVTTFFLQGIGGIGQSTEGECSGRTSFGCIGSAKSNDVPKRKLVTLSRSEIRARVANLRGPTLEDMRWIRNDSRNKEYDSFLRSEFGNRMSDNVRELILQSAQRLWFRMDHLRGLFESGEIGMATFSLGLNEILRMNDEFVASLLSDDDFRILTGGDSKADRVTPSGDYPVQSEIFAEIQANFPKIRNNEDIRSEKEVYRHVSEAALEEVMFASREQLSKKRSLQKSLLSGEISKSEFDQKVKEVRRATDVRINGALSKGEADFLFGPNEKID